VTVVAGRTTVFIKPDGTVRVQAATVTLTGDLEVGGNLSVAGETTLTGTAMAGGNEIMVVTGRDSGGDTMTESGQ
jgi:hypothetical protein